uniref:Probable deoxycytidylate deaminase n=1 Tax=Lygus hesperus TaxID=30085 RepID=A0A0A9VUP4_LYGHE
MEAGDASQSNQGEPDSSVPDSTEVREPGVNLATALQALRVAASGGDGSAGSSSGPRANYISWDDLFMSSAFLIAMRSKDPVTQVGACIVNEENKIVGMGYNGMPIGCDDKLFPWGKTGDALSRKFMYVCHAEMNAVLNKNSSDVKNCRIYVGLFPCNECAKIIIQSGIKEVIFLSDKNKVKPETVASKIMFEAAGVTYRRHVPNNSKITIDFSKIDWGNMSQLPTSPDRSTL